MFAARSPGPMGSRVPPKTKAGLRTVSISAGLVSALKVWKLVCLVSALASGFPR